MYYTHRAWWTVDDAAQVLRVNRKTLYDACKNHDFPHVRIPYIRIPAEALRMTVLESPQSPSKRLEQIEWGDGSEQLFLPLGPIIPVRKYWNENGRYGVGTYGRVVLRD